MYDALIAAQDALKDVTGRKAIIAVTDGLDNRSTHKADDVISGVKQNSLSISTIGLGDATSKAQTGLDETGLKSLAQQAGGSYSFAGDAQTLAALFQSYGRTLQSEYAITYLSPSKLRDGVNRNLTVSIDGRRSRCSQGELQSGRCAARSAHQSWLLFGGILVGLLVLLFAPILIRLGSRGIGGIAGIGGGAAKEGPR